jgi:hypothetical protein
VTGDSRLAPSTWANGRAPSSNSGNATLTFTSLNAVGERVVRVHRRRQNDCAGRQ